MVNVFLCHEQNDGWQKQQCVDKQHQDQNSNNSSFFIRGDTTGRQSSDGPTQEEDEQWERKEEIGGINCKIGIRMNPESKTVKDNRKDPDHNTDQHRDLDGSSEAVPQWMGNDQIPVMQDGHIVFEEL